MIQKEVFYLPSSDGHAKLFCVCWKPEGEVRMVLQLIHGMIEHIGFYEEFALFLARRGIAVVGHDHLGHGNTAENPQNLGFFAEHKGYTYLIKDIHRVRRHTEKRWEGIPYFMLGHSMGSFLLRRYITLFGTGLKGAILMGTGNQPKILVKLGLVLASAASFLLGADYRSQKANALFRRMMNRRFQPVRTSMDWLTTDENQVDRFLSDEKCQMLFSCSAYHDLLRLVNDSENRWLMKNIPKTLPVFLISGQEDPVGEFGKGVERAYENLLKAGLVQVEKKMYPGCRHELVIENNIQEVAEDSFTWMERVLQND